MVIDEQAQPPNANRSRYAWLDMARGIAVIAMTIFHFTWDLEFFRYVDAGLTAEPGWRWFARGVAASFLTLTGFSFVLAHRNGLRTRAFLVRFGQIATAAALISVATWFATPDRFVFFGILHQIAAASLIAALLLPLPWVATAAIAASIFLINSMWTSEIFNSPLLWWVGLAPQEPPTNDYVPLFPWTGWVVAGMTIAKLFLLHGPSARSATPKTASRPVKALQFLGRHSLIYYLVHQPAMIGLITLFSYLVPPPAPDLAGNFDRACVAGCANDRTIGFCRQFCTCVAADLRSKSIFEPVAKGELGVDDARVADAAQVCTVQASGSNGE